MLQSSSNNKNNKIMMLRWQYLTICWEIAKLSSFYNVDYRNNELLSATVEVASIYLLFLLFQQPEMIPQNLLPPSGMVDIFAVHTRLNPTQHLKIMPNDTFYVTAVRNPVTLFESLYNYFHLELLNGLTFKKYLRLPVEVSSFLTWTFYQNQC